MGFDVTILRLAPRLSHPLHYWDPKAPQSKAVRDNKMSLFFEILMDREGGQDLLVR